MTSNERIAWAAGYFEGDGTATLSDGKPMLSIKHRPDGEDVSRPLARFHQALRVGKIGGPYHQHNRKEPSFMWYATGEEAERAMKVLWPFLTEYKRQQWRDCSRKVR